MVWLLLLAAHCLSGAGDGAAVASPESSPSSSPGCPDGCECRWKGGKETAECVNASLVAVPTKLDRDTQVLDLTLNYLPRLEQGLFLDRVGLPNLQKVFLAYCSISEVEDHAFR